MAFTQAGDPVLGDWVVLPDFQAQQSKEGGWKATQSFQILRETLDDLTFQSEFTIGRLIGDLSPEIETYWEFLGLASIQRVRHAPGGYTIISAEFAGFAGATSTFDPSDPDPPPDPVPTFTLRSAVGERDILLHPKVIALAAPRDKQILKLCKEGKYVDNDGDISTHHIDEEGNEIFRPIPVQPTAGDAADFAVLIANGLHSYKFPTAIWQKTWDSTEAIKPAEINNVGLIDVPDGNPPAIDGNRDWMLTDATQEQSGLKFRNSKEWELSDRGGWDELLYEVD